jgi:hypothetical protein
MFTKISYMRKNLFFFDYIIWPFIWVKFSECHQHLRTTDRLNSAPHFWGSSKSDSHPGTMEVAQDTGSYAARVTARDYGINTPLPRTGETTIFRRIDELNSRGLFAFSPENYQLIELAESTNFLGEICLKETPRESTVFWLGYAKDGRGSLTVKLNQDLEFWNFDTYYAIERRRAKIAIY